VQAIGERTQSTAGAPGAGGLGGTFGAGAIGADRLAAGADRSTTEADPGALATDLYALVVHLHKNCNADLFEAVGTLELSLTQIKLLHHLDEQPREVSLKEAAEQVHVSLPAASRLVDDLYRRGFVEREEDREDRRMKRVRLTDTGREAIRRLNAARLSGLEQFIQALTGEERAAVAAALDTLTTRPEIAACRPEWTTQPQAATRPEPNTHAHEDAHP
jgi:DNA-binding MarR family transcriptional regulator